MGKKEKGGKVEKGVKRGGGGKEEYQPQTESQWSASYHVLWNPSNFDGCDAGLCQGRHLKKGGGDEEKEKEKEKEEEQQRKEGEFNGSGGGGRRIRRIRRGTGLPLVVFAVLLILFQ